MCHQIADPSLVLWCWGGGIGAAENPLISSRLRGPAGDGPLAGGPYSTAGPWIKMIPSFTVELTSPPGTIFLVAYTLQVHDNLIKILTFFSFLYYLLQLAGPGAFVHFV